MTYAPVEELVLHRAPMLLIDEVTEYEPERIACAVTVRSFPPLGTHDAVPGLVALEYMAQAVAAYAGLHARERGEPLLPGFLIGISRMDVQVPSFRVGERLTASARHTWGDARIGSFDATLTRSDTHVATATLKVARGDPKELGLA